MDLGDNSPTQTVPRIRFRAVSVCCYSLGHRGTLQVCSAFLSLIKHRQRLHHCLSALPSSSKKKINTPHNKIKKPSMWPPSFSFPPHWQRRLLLPGSLGVLLLSPLHIYAWGFKPCLPSWLERISGWQPRWWRPGTAWIIVLMVWYKLIYQITYFPRDFYRCTANPLWNCSWSLGTQSHEQARMSPGQLWWGTNSPHFKTQLSDRLIRKNRLCKRQDILKMLKKLKCLVFLQQFCCTIIQEKMSQCTCLPKESQRRSPDCNLCLDCLIYEDPHLPNSAAYRN